MHSRQLGMVSGDVLRKSSVVEKRFFARLTPNGDGIDENVMFHPHVFVEADFLPLQGELERPWQTEAAVELAHRVAHDETSPLFVLRQQKRGSVRIGRREGGTGPGHRHQGWTKRHGGDVHWGTKPGRFETSKELQSE